MKRLITTIITLAAIIADASAQNLLVQPIELQVGEQTEMVVSLAEGASATALQFNLQLPEGVTAEISSTTLGPATDGHTLSMQTLDSGDLLFILYSMDLKPFKDGELIRIPVTAGSTEATSNGKLYKVRTATADAVSHTCEDATFSVTIPTAINSVSRKDSAKNIYNVNGQQIGNTQKGINIVDGKKVMVK
ncbi:MAG: hypothetical protein IJT28_10155 [Bacteroidaceae bacterium]|nr:hypothetical protein [Bacteroidaceae bacterium]